MNINLVTPILKNMDTIFIQVFSHAVNYTVSEKNTASYFRYNIGFKRDLIFTLCYINLIINLYF